MNDFKRDLNPILKEMGGSRFTGNVFVEPCRETEGNGVEYCEPEKAEFWGVYVETIDRHDCRVSDWVEDFYTREDAEIYASDLKEYLAACFKLAEA